MSRIESENSQADSILSHGLRSLETSQVDAILGVKSRDMSERCVEVPWIAAQIGNTHRLLDIGFSMSPPEWMGVLLKIEENGTELVGIDIIDPMRVQSRYPAHQLSAVLDTNVIVGDFLTCREFPSYFDTITCVSTLEHIGFDKPSDPSNSYSAFDRADSPEKVMHVRDENTDSLFLDSCEHFLAPQGRVLISVPAGAGLPILHQDSLGLYTYQFEYDENSWDALISDPRFSIEKQAFYRHDAELGWHPVAKFAQLTDQTSALKPFATGCALVSLRLN